MATVRRELALNPSEIEISVECTKCGTRLILPLNAARPDAAIRWPPAIASNCPACNADRILNFDALKALRGTLDALDAAEGCKVIMTAPYPETEVPTTK